MKISLASPTDRNRTDIETECNVTVTDAYVGPIFRTRDGACLAVMMRDDDYELNCWRGDAAHDSVLPSHAIQFSVNPEGGVMLFGGLTESAKTENHMAEEPLGVEGIDHLQELIDIGHAILGAVSRATR